MYRIIPAKKSSYITNKYVAGSRSETSNVGQAGTLDLFKLSNETIVPNVSGSVVELSRLLIQYDITRLSGVNTNDPSFQCFANLKDVYGGQTIPSNFSLSLFPLKKEWTEGAGQDTVAFRDVGAVNFITASLINGSGTLWDSPGADAMGLDYDDTLEVTQSFLRGDEDLSMDITTIVSQTLAGNIGDNGFRISFTDALEQDENTYFVKRFGSRHVQNRDLLPSMVVKYNDLIQDDTALAWFDENLSFFTYNILDDEYQNFFSGSVEITGSDCVIVELEASRSIKYLTSSFSVSHDQIITHITSGIDHYSVSFSGSQFELNGVPQTGIYTSPIFVDTNQGLVDFLSGSTEQEFKVSWKSLDLTKTYATTWTTFQVPQANFSNYQKRNWVTNITNLKNKYSISSGKVRMRVFVYDYSLEQYKVTSRVPKRMQSMIIKDMRWRLRSAYERRIIVPFDEYTKLSYDEDGMYFDIFIEDLNVGEVYEIDFQINSETGRSQVIQGEGYRFKVVQ